MLATLFTALLQKFAEIIPSNVEEAEKSISLIFNDPKVRDQTIDCVEHLITRNPVPNVR
jgi:hypothetical protein